MIEIMKSDIDPPIEACPASSNHPLKKGDCNTTLVERNNWCRNTIAAIASAPGVGAVGVVRISGPETAQVLARVFEPSGKKTLPLPSHMLCHGTIRDSSGQLVDEVMCTVMYGPRSYTKEDVAEIYCHGGPTTVTGVASVLYESGARPAEPGEFTKRAFLNGRIDLSQAEAVMELISAKTDMARRAGLRKLSGGLSRKVTGARDQILKWLAHIELSVDYPEHEEEAMNLAMIREEGVNLLSDMEALRQTAKLGDMVKSGVPTVIVGRPNVGKSSLMNAILQEDRAIVTDIPGTTRDTLTESVTVRGVPILLTDTAGIREGADQVEQIGVERSVERAQLAELVLHVIDRSVPLSDEDFAVAELLEGQQKIIVFNKCDLEICDDVAFEDNSAPVIEVSAKTGEGLDALYRLVEEMFLEGAVSADGDIITQARHRYLLDGVIGHLKDAFLAIEHCMPEDIVAIDLKAAYMLLGEMIGEAVGDDVLDRIFAEFCVGK